MKSQGHDAKDLQTYVVVINSTLLTQLPEEFCNKNAQYEEKALK